MTTELCVLLYVAVYLLGAFLMNVVIVALNYPTGSFQRDMGPIIWPIFLPAALVVCFVFFINQKSEDLGEALRNFFKRGKL